MLYWLIELTSLFFFFFFFSRFWVYLILVGFCSFPQVHRAAPFLYWLSLHGAVCQVWPWLKCKKLGKYEQSTEAPIRELAVAQWLTFVYLRQPKVKTQDTASWAFSADMRFCFEFWLLSSNSSFYNTVCCGKSSLCRCQSWHSAVTLSPTSCRWLSSFMHPCTLSFDVC